MILQDKLATQELDHISLFLSRWLVRAGNKSLFMSQNGQYNGKQILSPLAVQLLTTEQSHGRAFGFGISSSYSWIKGSFASPQTFSHSGYTGTSLVCDPTRSLSLIILTNRAHPNDKGTVKPLRTQIANIVFQNPDPR